MSDERYDQLDFEDRMATVTFDVSDTAHIEVNGDSCRGWKRT